MSESPHEQLTPAQWEKIRRKCTDDPWAFAQLVIPDDRGVERFHRPMLYLATGCADLFMGCMERPEYDSAIMDSVRDWSKRHGIDLNTIAGNEKLHRIIGKSGVNLRISRSMAKTTYAAVGQVWRGTKNPDIDIGIASKSDPATQRVIESCANTIRSESYATFFPERLASDAALRDVVNRQRCLLAGRTRTIQSTIEGRGLLGNWTGPHYDVVWADDIVGTASGEASIGDALRWIAAIRGISKAAALGGTWRLFTGTVYDDGDDHNAVHVNDSTLLSVVVPIWTKPEYNLSRLMEDGVPTLEEWYPVAEIREMRKQTLSGPGGPSSWLNNFELTTISASDRRMPEALLRRQTLVVETDSNGNEIYMRPDGRGIPQKRAARDLDIAAGLDQAFASTSRSDEWVFGLVGQDTDGHRYLMDGVSGRGYDHMLAAVVPNWKRWNQPMDVGVDTTGLQIITTDMMKREASFNQIVSSLREVSASNVSKAARIIAFIVAGLRSGQLWIHPRLTAFIEQARLWNPDSPRAKLPGTDDWLDAFSIALEVLRSTPVSEADLARSRFNAYAATVNQSDRGLAEDIFGGNDLYDVLFDGWEM